MCSLSLRFAQFYCHFPPYLFFALPCLPARLFQPPQSTSCFHFLFGYQQNCVWSLFSLCLILLSFSSLPFIILSCLLPRLFYPPFNFPLAFAFSLVINRTACCLSFPFYSCLSSYSSLPFFVLPCLQPVRLFQPSQPTSCLHCLTD